jgi:hypothetical protein
MKPLLTRISLPVPLLPGTTVRALLELIFEKFRWFPPARYGFAALDSALHPEQVDYAALLAVYEELKALTIAGRTDEDFLLILTAKDSEFPFTGSISWTTSATAAAREPWREKHLHEVAEIMRLLNSPLGVSSLREDLKGKTQRWVRDETGEALTFTVRDPSEGLAGLFWRNFFGPPFVQLFEERLDSLPTEFKQELGEGIVLVQPYELPTQAGTPEGLERERQLIEHLGPECFYDHPHHRKPTRLPKLPSSPG